MTDRWLENLQKVHETPLPAPVKPRLNVDPQFSDLVEVDDDMAIIEKATGILDSDPYVTVLDPVGDLVEKTRRDRLGIPEIAAPVEHPDGVEFERCADMVFKFHWQGGNLVKSETFHPDTGWESVDEPLRPIFVEEKLAKMIGVTPDVRDLNDRVRSEIRYDLRRPSSPKEKSDLEAMTDGLDELLGSYASKPDASKKKAAATAMTYNVGGERLAKGQITSRMLAVLSKIRSFCIGSEEKEIEKAINCLDFTAFGELSEPVLERMRSAIESARH